MNTLRVGFLHSIKHRLTAAVFLAAFVLSAISAKAVPTAFSRLVVFGDSLSDTGNLYTVLGGTYPPPPYYQGRFCNGPVWVEYLAGDLGLTLSPGDDYAISGATTGRDNYNDLFLGTDLPGLHDQIDHFLADSGPNGADPEALYVVWVGANDFFVTLERGGSVESLIGTGVANTVAAVQRLWVAGARHILVANVGDLGLTPDAIGAHAGGPITQLAALYNYYLGGALLELQAAGVSTLQLDSFAVLQSMAYSPAQYGLVNVSDPLLFTGGTPDEFLFWDGVHPTTRAHQVMADSAVTRLLETFSPSRGIATPPARINGLKGLVTANEKH